MCLCETGGTGSVVDGIFFCNCSAGYTGPKYSISSYINKIWFVSSAIESDSVIKPVNLTLINLILTQICIINYFIANSTANYKMFWTELTTLPVENSIDSTGAASTTTQGPITPTLTSKITIIFVLKIYVR